MGACTHTPFGGDMKFILILMLAAITMFERTEAAVLCANEGGAIVTRVKCKKTETRLDLSVIAKSIPAASPAVVTQQVPAAPVTVNPPAIDLAPLKRAAEAAGYTVPLSGGWDAGRTNEAGAYTMRLIDAAIAGDKVAAALVPSTATAYLQSLLKGYARGNVTYANGFTSVIAALAPAQSFALRRFRATLEQDSSLSALSLSNRGLKAATWWSEVLAAAKAGDSEALSALPEAAEMYAAVVPGELGTIVSALRAMID